MDSEMIRLLSKAYAFCEEEGHAIMDCPFMPFHIRQVLLGMWNYRMWQDR